MKNWNDISEAFSELNLRCNYLVMRNWEEFYDDILLEGHNDIDVLCGSKKDKKIMTEIFDAQKRGGKDDNIHYKIMYQNQEVDLDIRTVGDGYYDAKWQKNMLKNKELSEKGFYKMNPEDYLYSLIYHAIYQKKILTDEYFNRLKSMSENIGISIEKQYDLEAGLYDFMCRNGYWYTKPYDTACMHNYNNPWVKKRYDYPLTIHIRHIVKAIKIRANGRYILLQTKKIVRGTVGDNIYESIKNRLKGSE